MRTPKLALGPILALGAGLATAAPSEAAPGLDPSAEPAAISTEAAAPDAEAGEPSAASVSGASGMDAATAPDATSPDAIAPAATSPGAVPADAAAPAAGAGAPGAEPSPSVARSPSEPAPAAGAPALPGAIGYDKQGRRGWIHVVRTGDTLWDISDGYLGTPWVWPSIWRENDDIENPHRIHPGDHIWITPGEMRRVTANEAAELLAGGPPLDAVPGSLEDGLETAVPLEGGTQTPRSIRFPNLEAVGLLRVEEIEAAASIVDSPGPQIMLSSGSRVYVGLGEGEAEVGDRFTVFRKAEQVRDPDTDRILGHFVDVLGWLEVVAVHPESVEGVIRESFSEIHRGDPVVPREPIPGDVEPRVPVEPVEGRIAFLPYLRDLGGRDDYVYLNRGALHGLDVGNRLEVFRPMGTGRDRVRRAEVSLPDDVIADLLVVSARPETAVAVVQEADTELELGDRFRSRIE